MDFDYQMSHNTHKRIHSGSWPKTGFEHIKLPAKLLDYFFQSNKNNINQSYVPIHPCDDMQNWYTFMWRCAGFIHTNCFHVVSRCFEAQDQTQFRSCFILSSLYTITICRHVYIDVWYTCPLTLAISRGDGGAGGTCSRRTANAELKTEPDESRLFWKYGFFPDKVFGSRFQKKTFCPKKCCWEIACFQERGKKTLFDCLFMYLFPDNLGKINFFGFFWTRSHWKETFELWALSIIRDSLKLFSW